jgi:hypothetical protein
MNVSTDVSGEVRTAILLADVDIAVAVAHWPLLASTLMEKQRKADHHQSDTNREPNPLLMYR